MGKRRQHFVPETDGIQGCMEFWLLFPESSHFFFLHRVCVHKSQSQTKLNRAKCEECENAPHSVVFSIRTNSERNTFSCDFITLDLLEYAANEQNFHVKVVRITRIIHKLQNEWKRPNKKGKKQHGKYNQICAVKYYLHFSLTQLFMKHTSRTRIESVCWKLQV